MTSIDKSIKNAIKFVFLNIIAFVTKIRGKRSRLFSISSTDIREVICLFNKRTDDLKRFNITCANEIITLAWFATGTKGSAPNIIDFPSYRVILCSLSEQQYTTRTALQMVKLPREPIYGARTCLTN